MKASNDWKRARFGGAQGYGLGFVVETRLESPNPGDRPLLVEFRVAEVSSYECGVGDEPDGPPQFPKNGALSSVTTTVSMDDAEYIASGSVKWDGCTNVNMHTDDCTWHGCDLRDVMTYGKAMEKAYRLCAAALIAAGTWHGDKADGDGVEEDWQEEAAE